MWQTLLGLLLCFGAATIIALAMAWAGIEAQVRIDGYAQLTLGPLWIMILPGYVAVSW